LQIPRESPIKITEEVQNMLMAKHAMIIVLVVVGGVLLASCGDATTGLAVGDPAPDFTLPSAAGDQVSLGGYTGNTPVLLYFHMAVG
jgi:hypothetical protein